MDLPKPCELSDRQLYQMALRPITSDMPENVKTFLSNCESEFSSRKHIKLVPIMNCNYKTKGA